MEETKKCPYCGGEILIEAKKCKHCKRWLNDTSLKNEDSSAWWKNSQVILWMVITVFLIVVFQLLLDKIL